MTLSDREWVLIQKALLNLPRRFRHSVMSSSDIDLDAKELAHKIRTRP